MPRTCARSCGLDRFTHRSRNATGLTLIELLVVISIMAVLIALLLAAVQRAREAGRRAQCASNLKMMCLGLLNYASTQQIPPGYISGIDAQGHDTGPGWGWLTLTLPCFESSMTYYSINLSLPVESPSNLTCRLAPYSWFQCPSDTVRATWPAVRRDPSSGAGVQTICEVASSNYIAMYGLGEPGPDGDGVFFRNSHITLRDITDGAAQTIFLGERSHGLGGATWTGSVTNGFLDTGDPVSIARHARATSPGMVLGHTGDGYGPGDPRSSVNEFSSLHPDGGVQFAFGDGHVAFLRSTMNAKTYRALATRAGGEVVPTGGY
jgi:prepilin-type N-terminal cleavage/methylation domain-containing protein/prepilin-type processing-associated H-X9-DG protein